MPFRADGGNASLSVSEVSDNISPPERPEGSNKDSIKGLLIPSKPDRADTSRPVSGMSEKESKNSSAPERPVSSNNPVKNLLAPFRTDGGNASRPVSEAVALNNLDDAIGASDEEGEDSGDYGEEQEGESPAKPRQYRLPSIFLKDIGLLSSDEYLHTTR